MTPQQIKTKVSEQIKSYIQLFPEEKDRVKYFVEVLQGDSDITTRSNMQGHITANAIIFSKTKRQVLMIKHNSLNRWLSPGGHFDIEDELLWITARREAIEETGIKENQLELHPWHQEHNLNPIDIDSHIIPANTKKGEGEHYHFDFRYIFILTENTSNITLQVEEVSDFKWIDLEKIDDAFSSQTKEKIQNIL